MRKAKPNNTVRFAWWGAEEQGLLGSEYYVEQLTAEEIGEIKGYLNFDMVGSPNYMFGSTTATTPAGPQRGLRPAGRRPDRGRLRGLHDERRPAVQDSEFSGRSDYGPFIAVASRPAARSPAPRCRRRRPRRRCTAGWPAPHTTRATTGRATT